MGCGKGSLREREREKDALCVMCVLCIACCAQRDVCPTSLFLRIVAASRPLSQVSTVLIPKAFFPQFDYNNLAGKDPFGPFSCGYHASSIPVVKNHL